MGNFSEGFWDIFIFIFTVGGIFALYLFLRAYSADRAEGEKAQTMGHVWDEDLAELNNPLPRWWLNLFYITLAFAVGYLFLYPGLGSNDMALGWTQVKQYEEEMAAAEARYGPLFERYAETEIPVLAGDPEAMKVGERLFATYCTTCHGSDARGVRGFPNLTDSDWLYGGDPVDIETSILAGRNGVMPKLADALGGEAGVHEVVQYVLGLSGREVEAGAAQAGKAKFEQLCAACHMPDGTGNQALGAPNLTDDIWLYGGSPAAVEATIVNGRQGYMPAHREFLGEAKVHLLATYVYGLSRRSE